MHKYKNPCCIKSLDSQRSSYCNECSVFFISSSGPAQSAQPNSFGSYVDLQSRLYQSIFPSYAVVGSFWENFLPYFKNALTGLYFTIHPNANPEIYYVPWVVSENPVDGMGDISHVTIKTQVTAVTMMTT